MSGSSASPVSPVSLAIQDGIARLRLTRPDAGNAINLDCAVALGDALEQLSTDGSVRALLISADGPHFTVGGDLKFLADQVDDFADTVDGMLAIYHSRVLPVLDELPFPIVTAVQGGAAGGGLGLVWCADVVIAGDTLKLRTGFDKLGLSGDGGSSWHLPRLVGLRRAQQILIGGETVDAQRALDWGLVTSVVPLADLESTAETAVQRLADGPTYALTRMRRLLLQSSSTSHADQLLAERQAMHACAIRPDLVEGMHAFIERRTPDFRQSGSRADE